MFFCFFGPKACGILVPDQKIELAPPALEGEVLTTGPPGKSPNIFSNVLLNDIDLSPVITHFKNILILKVFSNLSGGKSSK